MILTDRILLIEPIGFGFNPETAADNKFQNAEKTNNVQKQFDKFKIKLEDAGLNLLLFSPGDGNTPDALYPNNWFSTFPDKSMIIYPMMAVNRRAEKRKEFIDHLKHSYSKITDLSFLENSDTFLEGTGSLVIDHELKIAYACLSNRTSANAIEEWKNTTGYKLIEFTAKDDNHFPIYHTNVILTLSPDFVIVCLESIIPADKKRIENHLRSTGREIISISIDQVKKFCGNCLALRNNKNDQLLVMSDQAKSAFTNIQIKEIEKSTSIISTDLGEIETIGGGGARCMIAELF